MRIKLDYGKEGLWGDFPDRNVDTVLGMGSSRPLADPEGAVEDALREPISAPPLSDLAAGKGSACVVISDITRPVPNRTILPPILRTLETSGIPREQITILVATGIHRPNEGEELASMVGEEIAQEYRIVNHRSRAPETMTYLGKTSRGAPIYVDTVYLDAELRITTALIEPHLMAGYSGGRKAICPGICGIETMRVLHGPEIMASPRSAEGILAGNPFHQQSLEVARRARVDFIVNVTMDAERRVTGVFAGDLEDAHEAGMTCAEEQASAYVDAPLDIVVTTSAGYPLDLTFYQAVKGLTAVLPVVKEGGTIVLVAQCAEGMGGPEFTKLMREVPGCEAFLRRIEDPEFFMVDQWQVQEMCKALRKAKVRVYSEGVSPADLEGWGISWAPSLGDALGGALAEHGNDAKVAVIPKGPYVLARVRDV